MRFEGVVEPFSGLGRDDLQVEVAGQEVRLRHPEDPLLKRRFEAPIGDPRPRIGGKPASLEEAVAAAAELMRGRRLLISGLGTDLAGMRAVLALADRLGAVVDPASGDALFRNLAVLQDRGWITTTLSEVKNRADLLLLVGVAPELLPPLLERCFQGDGLFVRGEARRLLAIGPELGELSGYTCPMEALFAEVARLKAIVEGFPVAAPEPLFEIADALKNASYPVVAWSAASLDLPHAELLIEMVVELVRHLNLSGRAAGLPLGGRDGATTAQNVTAWQTGYPLRVSFARGFPEYDPHRFAARRLLEEGEVDLLLWLEAFDPENLPPVSRVPTVVLGRSDMAFPSPPELFIPVGTPGIDHPGHIFRMDGVVALRLRQLRESGLPSVAEVVREISKKV